MKGNDGRTPNKIHASSRKDYLRKDCSRRESTHHLRLWKWSTENGLL